MYPTIAFAISGKHLEIVEKLVQAGSDVNLVVQGRSMLQRAKFTENPKMIKLLLEAGAQ